MTEAYRLTSTSTPRRGVRWCERRVNLDQRQGQLASLLITSLHGGTTPHTRMCGKQPRKPAEPLLLFHVVTYPTTPPVACWHVVAWKMPESPSMYGMTSLDSSATLSSKTEVYYSQKTTLRHCVALNGSCTPFCHQSRQSCLQTGLRQR